MGLGLLHMLGFWLLVVLAVVLAVRLAGDAPGDRPRSDTALEILKQRYAKGEIGREEYEQKRHDLEA